LQPTSFRVQHSTLIHIILADNYHSSVTWC